MKRRLLERAAWQARRWAYRLGFRPRFGSILYSPSADLIYGYRDAANGRRASRLGHLLGIHSPSAHLLAGCWCQGLPVRWWTR